METHDFAGTVTFVCPRQFIIVSSDIFVPVGLLNATIAVGDRVVGTMVPGPPGARNPWKAVSAQRVPVTSAIGRGGRGGREDFVSFIV